MRKIKNNSKFLFGILLALVVVGIVGLRIKDLRAAAARQVYNIERINKEVGVPVDSIVVNRKRGVVTEPLFVKDGISYVSAARAAKFKAGQKVGARGRVTHVSRNVDLDTGLYAVRVSGASGGAHIELECDGFFVPVSAINNQESAQYLMVNIDGYSVKKHVDVVCQDSEMVVVSGLSNGDIVVLSKIGEGVKLRGIN